MTSKEFPSALNYNVIDIQAVFSQFYSSERKSVPKSKEEKSAVHFGDFSLAVLANNNRALFDEKLAPSYSTLFHSLSQEKKEFSNELYEERKHMLKTVFNSTNARLDRIEKALEALITKKNDAISFDPFQLACVFLEHFEFSLPILEKIIGTLYETVRSNYFSFFYYSIYINFSFTLFLYLHFYIYILYLKFKKKSILIMFNNEEISITFIYIIQNKQGSQLILKLILINLPQWSTHYLL